MTQNYVNFDKRTLGFAKINFWLKDNKNIEKKTPIGASCHLNRPLNVENCILVFFLVFSCDQNQN